MHKVPVAHGRVEQVESEARAATGLADPHRRMVPQRRVLQRATCIDVGADAVNCESSLT